MIHQEKKNLENPGSIIARIAEQRGITLYRLEQMSGLARSTITAMSDSGGNNMRLNVLRRICAALSISPMTIIDLLPPVDLDPPPPVGARGRKKLEN